MNIIIPMAGAGKRLRPHTLTIPKPLIPVAGKPIVYHLVEELSKITNAKIDHIGFVVGDFGKDVEDDLCIVARSFNAIPHIFYQKLALGTAHAVSCAAEILEGPVIVAFADTLFKAEFTISPLSDSTIWVKKVENPSSFGVVKLNDKNNITGFVEKPKTFVSDLAIIGIYYFKDGVRLKEEISFLLDNNIQVNGEYQLTDVLQSMQNKGMIFEPGEVLGWYDCGNDEATIETNKSMLKHQKINLIAPSVHIENSIIIEPCFINENSKIINSILGPYVSVGKSSFISHCIIKNALIQNETDLSSIHISESMIGNHVTIKGKVRSFSVGDYNKIEEH